MLPEVALRSETEEDIPFLLAVYASTRADEMAMVPWTAEQKDAFVLSQFGFQRTHYLQHYQGSTFDIIMVDGEPAGRLYVHRGPGEFRIVDIAIMPEFRGRGVGGFLLTQVMEEAREADKVVSIHVERNNPARHLYDRLGFQLIGEQGPVYLLMEWRPAG